MELLEEIDETWSTEGKDEIMSRFFFHLKFIDRLKKGNKFFVVGRKGSGKTAIAKYIDTEVKHNQFSVKLDFKSFPFNNLYDLYDKDFTVPNQYITIWKYVIYTNIVKLMGKNNNIELKVRNQIDEIYNLDPRALSSKIRKWTDINFRLPWFGGGMKREETTNETNWIEKVEILEHMIRENIDDAQYYVIFDELDEDYREVLLQNKNKNYLSLIVSLFKAIQEIKSIFEDKKNVLLPIAFLRDDIYEIIMDNDKNKWNNNIIYVNWDIDKIKDMIAYRISKTIDSQCTNILDFDDAWKKIFENKEVPFGNAKNRKSAKIISHITKLTHMRPRDYIYYIMTSAKASIEKEQFPVRVKTLKSVDEAFSNYLKRELQDEIFAILPNINLILNIFSQYKKQYFKLEDFQKFYVDSSSFSELTKEEQDINFVLKVLFHFSVIGNMSKDTKTFKYQNKEATINYKQLLTLHRGLFSSLKVNT